MAKSASAEINMSQTLDFMKGLGEQIKNAKPMLEGLGDKILNVFDSAPVVLFAKKLDILLKTVTAISSAFLAVEKVLSNVFSLLRSIAMTSINGLISGLGKAFDWLRNGVQGSLSNSWNAKVLGTNGNNLKALEWAEKYTGTDGLIKSGVQGFRQGINDPNKMKSYLALGATNEDLERWQGMDSIQGFFEFMKKAQGLGYNVNDRSFYDSIGGADTGMSYEEYIVMAKEVGKAEKEYKRINKQLGRNEGAMKSSERALLNLDMAFENIRNKLISAFSPALNEIISTISSVIQTLSKEFLTKENIKMFSSALQGFIGKIADFVKNDGISKLKEAIVSMAEFFMEFVYGVASFTNNIKLTDIDLTSGFMGEIGKILEDKKIMKGDIDIGNTVSQRAFDRTYGQGKRLSWTGLETDEFKQFKQFNDPNERVARQIQKMIGKGYDFASALDGKTPMKAIQDAQKLYKESGGTERIQYEVKTSGDTATLIIKKNGNIITTKEILKIQGNNK